MTYEEKVHYFGLRWLLENSNSAARLREMDPTRQITLETTADGSGCSCDYDYWVEYHLSVPHIDGGHFRVEITDMGFAEILKGVTEAEPVEDASIDKMINEAQAQQIVKLQTELNEKRVELGKVNGELRVLKNGLSQQQGLWTYLRNLYKDLQDYTDGSTGLSDSEMQELCAFLYRELDLWFNKDIGVSEANGRVVWDLKVSR